jgi:hypothetical protein
MLQREQAELGTQNISLIRPTKIQKTLMYVYTYTYVLKSVFLHSLDFLAQGEITTPHGHYVLA